ncbi:MAG: WbqC-like protein family protein [uncultured bacterium]|nr:MAG: WbqC-like protein family protein [uncultured bacterium]OGH13719.1 MAG: hypothetical protein A2687_02925 [Candidatus Levybacteria bacterium RIFCSPHIGHO2_01_FULL_38_26]
MRYSGIQPHYFPRLHYFARMMAADVFVLRDEVQFVRKHKYPDGKTGKSYQVHTPIKHSAGIHFLMTPILHNGKESISKTRVLYSNHWVESHLKSVEIFYRKSLNFKILFPEIQAILKNKYKTLAELNIATILWGLLRLGGLEKVSLEDLSIDYVLPKLKKQTAFRLKSLKKASESKILAKLQNATPNEKIVTLIKEAGANEDYCGGTGFTAYMDKDLFKKNGIKIVVQDWKCREYPQLFTKQRGFIPNLSIIDLLMNVPSKKALEIIKGE